MIKRLGATLGAMFVLAGPAQAAEAQEPAMTGEKTLAAQRSAFTNEKKSRVTEDDADKAAIKPVESELHPDARPVYLNGGHFGE